MGTIMPQRAALTVWRITLALIACIPAFLTSLFFQAYTAPWVIASGVWVGGFLFFYLVYLPLRLRRLSFSVREGNLLVRSGVFYSQVRALPLANIQFTATASSPLGRLFGLRALHVVAAGGHLALPGLKQSDAETLAALLLQDWAED